MLWFKVMLATVLFIQVIRAGLQVARATEHELERTINTPILATIEGIIMAFLAIGVWFWL